MGDLDPTGHSIRLRNPWAELLVVVTFSMAGGGGTARLATVPHRLAHALFADHGRRESLAHHHGRGGEEWRARHDGHRGHDHGRGGRHRSHW